MFNQPELALSARYLYFLIYGSIRPAQPALLYRTMPYHHPMQLPLVLL
jgi:hypothetical protein